MSIDITIKKTTTENGTILKLHVIELASRNNKKEFNYLVSASHTSPAKKSFISDLMFDEYFDISEKNKALECFKLRGKALCPEMSLFMGAPIDVMSWKILKSSAESLGLNIKTFDNVRTNIMKAYGVTNVKFVNSRLHSNSEVN